MNPGRPESIAFENIIVDTSLWGITTSSTETDVSLAKTKFSLYYQMSVSAIKCPLTWWKDKEKIFPHVAFMAWQFLGIHGSQIECEDI